MLRRGSSASRRFRSRGARRNPRGVEPTRARTWKSAHRRAGPGGLLGGKAPPPLSATARSVVVQDRADAAILGEQRAAAVAEQIQVEVLVGLLLAVAVDDDRDRLGRLAG